MGYTCSNTAGDSRFQGQFMVLRIVQSPPASNTMRDKTTHTYHEVEPTVWEAVRKIVPTKRGIRSYLKSLFPCVGWLPRYNWRWLLGDCIAGLTAGLVIIPQAMAYALLATLSPDFGLYTSFVGAATYWLFGTSKDIVIGVCSYPSCQFPMIIPYQATLFKGTNHCAS